MKNFKFLFILLTMGIFFSCKERDVDMSNIDFSNIENLYEQPLPVIKKCVEGKWQWVHISRWGFLGSVPLTHTFVEITENSVDITQDGYEFVVISGTFSYNWLKKTTLSNRATYVIRAGDGQIKMEWYFNNIQNDSLYVYADNASMNGITDVYLFLRINEQTY